MNPCFLLAALSGAAPAAAAPVPAVPTVPTGPTGPTGPTVQQVVCAAHGAEYRAELEGTLTLHKAFLGPEEGRDAALRDAVRHQVKYVWGYLRNHPQHRREVKAALSAEEPQVQILSTTDVPYGRDLTLDWNHIEPHLNIDEPYMQRAVTAGRALATDPALAVRYRVAFALALCGKRRGPDSTLTVPLPRDPWLFYWHVPSSQHRTLVYGQSTALTNPCSDDDFADLPHPFYYWYDWRVERQGPDANGLPYNCHTLLKPGVDHTPHTLRLHKTGEAGGAFEDLAAQWPEDGPLRITLLVGVANNLLTSLDVRPLAEALPEGRPLAASAQAALDGGAFTENGALEVLAFLRAVDAVAPLASHTVTVRGQTLQVDAQARLRRSGRAVRLRVHHGFTNVFGAVPPDHWEAARDALTQDHVVLYVGHSGIGENLRVSQMEKNLALPAGSLNAPLASAPYQWVGFLSCFSYMYFGQDLMAAGGRGRQYVFSATGYSDGERGAVGVVDLVDQVLVHRVTGVKRYFGPEDFILFKSLPAR